MVLRINKICPAKNSQSNGRDIQAVTYTTTGAIRGKYNHERQRREDRWEVCPTEKAHSGRRIVCAKAMKA